MTATVSKSPDPALLSEQSIKQIPVLAVKMRNIINLFGKIKSFETVTLHTSGMRHVIDYEIVKSGENAEISLYAVGYCDGEEVRQLQKRAVCSAKRAL